MEGGCNFFFKQIIYSKKLLSTKFYLKLALVLMGKEPSEASLHKLKGSLNYAERSEVQVFH